MGKAKKQLTNERRARRLGTGEGIAAKTPKGGGGVPAWAWLVAGSVVVAAVIIGVALVGSRGGGGGSNSGADPSAAVVTSRLSHEKIDFISAGTWPVNYTDLAGAMSALGLTPTQEGASVNHYHVHVQLTVDGHDVPVPADIGLDSSAGVFSEVHTHDDTGVVHIESGDTAFRASLADVFDMWGVYLSPKCIGGYCGGVQMWVNGKPSTAYGKLVLQSHMAITLLEGAAPSGFKPAKSYKFAAGE
jgi:hypothetical protein